MLEFCLVVSAIHEPLKRALGTCQTASVGEQGGSAGTHGAAGDRLGPRRKLLAVQLFPSARFQSRERERERERERDREMNCQGRKMLAWHMQAWEWLEP